MSRTFAEILLLVPAAMCAGFVVFIAGVIQGTMNDMKEAEFKDFLASLERRALRSPYAIAISTVSFVGMFPYFIFYGFGNLWFTSGCVLWVIASIISKMTALPLYARVKATDRTDTTALHEERRKLHVINVVRASITALSIALMTLGFMPR